MDFDDLDANEGEEEEAQEGEAGEEEPAEMVEVTFWIPINNDTLTVPVSTTDTIADAKEKLADMYGVDPPTIRLGLAEGAYVNYYSDDELVTAVGVLNKICVKGIYEFSNTRRKYTNPWVVIGGGHLGCRQAIELTRRKYDYTLFERKDCFGGNAWATIANKQSRLQSEACSYQIQFDPFTGGKDTIWKNLFYTGDQDNQWPSAARICENYKIICDEYEVPYRLNTEVTKMKIVPEESDYVMEPNKWDFERSYDLTWESTKDDDDEGIYKVDCITLYPGAMAHPKRHVWPGEQDSDLIIGYGFSNEFPYDQIEGKVGIIIGMGAFFAENIRTVCEYKTKKIWGVCRHYNLMCPRMCSWTMSISYSPAPAPVILDVMQPMYKLAGLQDPWDWWSIQNKNESRTMATIKQYTRWGVGDIYFLALYYGRCEMITGEVETFLPKGAKLKAGSHCSIVGGACEEMIKKTMKLDIDYVVKVLGFLSDFTADKLMQCEKMLGPFPEGDMRRWVFSDQSEIDANRFGSLGMSYHAAGMVRQAIWILEHPIDQKRLEEAGVLVYNYAEPELGLTAYHYHPRRGTANMIMVAKYCPTLDSFHVENDLFRVELYNEQANPELWLQACSKDWNKYCDLFESLGDTVPRPPYPYTLEFVEGIVDKGTEAEQAYLDYKTNKEFRKEALGYVCEFEAAQR